MNDKEELLQTENLLIYKDKKTNTREVNLNVPLYQTNFLTEAQQILSKSVYRTIKFIVKKIQDERFKLQDYVKNLETLKVYIPPKELEEWYPDAYNRSRDLDYATKWLNNTSVRYETPGGWTNAKLIGEAIYDDEKGLNIFITPSAIPLYNIAGKNFTLLDFAVAMNLQSKSAAFFYDKCCKWRSSGVFSYVPEALEEALNISATASRIKTRYLIPSELELKKLYLRGTIDFYVDIFEQRGGKGRGGKLEKFVFRIHSSIPGSDKDTFEQISMRTQILNNIKSLVPDIISNNIATQLREMSREELKDLCIDLDFIKSEVEKGKIKDLKGVVWMNLRNKYNININGDTRLQKNANYSYPKYKRVGICIEELIKEEGEENLSIKDTISEIKSLKEEYPDPTELNKKYWELAVDHVLKYMEYNGMPISDSEKESIKSLLLSENITTEYDGNTLSIIFKPDIFKLYIYEPYNPVYESLKKVLRDAVYTYYPNIKVLNYVSNSTPKKTIFNMSK